MNAVAWIAPLALLVPLLLAGTADAEDLKVDLKSMCPSVYRPVCADKDGHMRSFGNACLAEREGYEVTDPGYCGAARGLPRFCSKEYQPVCAEKNGERRQFGNACEAAAADFAVVRDGAC